MFKVFLRTIKVILDFKYWELRGLPNLHNHRRLIGIWQYQNVKQFLDALASLETTQVIK